VNSGSGNRALVLPQILLALNYYIIIIIIISIIIIIIICICTKFEGQDRHGRVDTIMQKLKLFHWVSK